MKRYEHTENGVTTALPLAEGLAIINYAMMDGKRFVRTMNASRGDAQIEYKNGIKITLRQVEVETPKEPQEWSGTRSNARLLHRFNPETLRGRCNKRFFPVRYADGYSLRSRSMVENSEFADLYNFCPKCNDEAS